MYSMSTSQVYNACRYTIEKVCIIFFSSLPFLDIFTVFRNSIITILIHTYPKTWRSARFVLRLKDKEKIKRRSKLHDFMLPSVKADKNEAEKMFPFTDEFLKALPLLYLMCINQDKKMSL